jgi:Flp pilus assembly pilin Flp
MQMLTNWRARTRVAAGQSIAEYALILSLIVLVAVAALTLFGSQIDTILSAIADQIQS